MPTENVTSKSKSKPKTKEVRRVATLVKGKPVTPGHAFERMNFNATKAAFEAGVRQTKALLGAKDVQKVAPKGPPVFGKTLLTKKSSVGKKTFEKVFREKRGKEIFKIWAAKKLSPLEAHDLVTEGLPVLAARSLMASFNIIDRGVVLRVVGISERTLQRGKTEDKLLDTNASDRALRLISVTQQAIEVLGSREAAERWLSSPAMGLDRRKPIDLLQSTEGTELVKTLLTRMDYGIYT